MVYNGSKWLEMFKIVSDGLKWTHMFPNTTNWSQLD